MCVLLPNPQANYRPSLPIKPHLIRPANCSTNPNKGNIKPSNPNIRIKAYIVNPQINCTVSPVTTIPCILHQT